MTDSTPKKISILAPDLSGGKVQRTYLIAELLQMQGYDVTVFGFMFGQKLNPPPQTLKLSYALGCTYPKMLKTSFSLLKKIDGDIIYAMKPLPTTLGIALLKRLRSKKPVILDIDDLELNDLDENSQYKFSAKNLLKKNNGLNNPQHQLYLQWSEKLIEKANAITVGSKFLEYRYGGTFLPNSQNTNLFNADYFNPETSREKYGLSKYRVLMFTDDITPNKGLEDVLMALEEINQLDLKLVLITYSNTTNSYLENLIKKWGNWMLLLQFPQPSVMRMPEIISAAHIIVVPQREEKTLVAKFSGQVINGMAMAKPIIASRVGDIPETLGDTGFLVESQSPQQIAKAIQEVFNDWDKAQTKGIQARQRCLDNYSLNKMTSTLEKVISLVER